MCDVVHSSFIAALFQMKRGGVESFLDECVGENGAGFVKTAHRRFGSVNMDRVLIIGGSGGIGMALVKRLGVQGAQIVALSRSVDGLDITNEESVEAHLGALQGPFDGIIIATGALEIDGAGPEKSIKSVTAASMAAQFAVNAIGPALVLRHAARLLPRDKRSICAVLSARVGSIGDNRIGGWTSYRAAKAAANQIVHTTAIELARTHPDLVCVALHPGTVETPFTAKYLGRHPAVPADEAAQNLLSVMSQLTPKQTGGFFDWAGEEVAW
jgi:NAD(P)-dependent dehydrogenase (short-subunit alcohol dehydrogenase family)